MRATFARIHLENLKYNLEYIQSKMSRNSKMCVAVKADAYGHGAVECARTALEAGAQFLAVATVAEGIELRQAGIGSGILVLSLCQQEEMESVVENDLTPLVFDSQYIGFVEEAARKVGRKGFKVHLAVDTGMGRIGCLPEEAGKVALRIVEGGVLSLGGICTHFSVADSVEKENVAYTERQFELFLSAVENVKKEGIDPGIRHCANSAITLIRPEMHLDMCRPGIIAYGYYPGQIDRNYFEKKGEKKFLKPVMELVTKVVAVRDFEEDRCVSYGRKWTSEQKTKIGVLPIGYADGLFRRFNPSEGGTGLFVAIDGKKYPVCGRICMDQCMVNLGADSKVHRYSEAVIFGPEGSGALQSAQEIADATGTISYEITCGVSRRVPRIFVTSETR